MSTITVWDFDVSKMHFNAPSYNSKGQKIIDITTKPGSTQYADRVNLQLCPDTDMCVAKYALSSGKMKGVPDRRDADNTRRDWKLINKHKPSSDALKRVDEAILKAAFENRSTWFPKKEYTMEQLAEKYKGAIREEDPEGGVSVIKVKCPDPKKADGPKPTEIKRLLPTGEFEMGTIEDLVTGAETIPIVSVYNVWMMTDGGFGITLQANKLLVKPVPKPTFLDNFVLTKPLVEVTSAEENDEMKAVASEE